MKKISLTLTIIFILLIIIASTSDACTTIMVGREASADGSVLMARSNDGNIMSWIEYMPALQFNAGTEIPMYSVRPMLGTIEQTAEQIRKGFDLVGYLPMPSETYQMIVTRGRWYDRTLGGINEHGVSIALEYLSFNPMLASRQGLVGPGGAGHWTTSMIANALMRSKTAREAVEFMGWMAEEYGYQYFLDPAAGSGQFVADKDEIWMMYTAGPGFDWEPASGKKGAVWVAQRVLDDQVVVHANACRIGKIDLSDTENFMASDNIYSLALELGLWFEDEEFIFHEVYGLPKSRGSELRVWGGYHLIAPSLNLTMETDNDHRFPLAVTPDEKLDVADLLTIMRYYYQDTPYDITLDPAFELRGEKSPLARPFGPGDLFRLLGIRTERTIAVPSTTYVFIAQLRDNLPSALANLIWFAQGPSFVSTFVPIYAGVNKLHDSYATMPDWDQVNRSQNAWNLQLTHGLSYLKFQDAILDIKNVYQPAEKQFFQQQPALEEAALAIYQNYGSQALVDFLTTYSYNAMQQTYYTYNELVDYLLYQYVWGYPEIANVEIPQVLVPNIPSFSLD